MDFDSETKKSLDASLRSSSNVRDLKNRNWKMMHWTIFYFTKTLLPMKSTAKRLDFYGQKAWNKWD